MTAQVETKSNGHSICHSDYIPASSGVRCALEVGRNKQESLNVSQAPAVKYVYINEAFHALVEHQG